MPQFLTQLQEALRRAANPSGQPSSKDIAKPKVTPKPSGADAMLRRITTDLTGKPGRRVKSEAELKEPLSKSRPQVAAAPTGNPTSALNTKQEYGDYVKARINDPRTLEWIGRQLDLNGFADQPDTRRTLIRYARAKIGGDEAATPQAAQAVLDEILRERQALIAKPEQMPETQVRITATAEADRVIKEYWDEYRRGNDGANTDELSRVWNNLQSQRNGMIERLSEQIRASATRSGTGKWRSFLDRAEATANNYAKVRDQRDKNVGEIRGAVKAPQLESAMEFASRFAGKEVQAGDLTGAAKRLKVIATGGAPLLARALTPDLQRQMLEAAAVLERGNQPSEPYATPFNPLDPGGDPGPVSRERTRQELASRVDMKAQGVAYTPQDVEDSTGPNERVDFYGTGLKYNPWASNLSKSVAKTERGNEHFQNKNDLEIFGEATFYATTPNRTALMAASGVAWDELPEEVRAGADLSDFAIQMIVSQGLSEAFAGSQVAARASALMPHLSKFGKAAPLVEQAGKVVKFLGDKAPEFLLLDLPGYTKMISDNGGDIGKASAMFAGQILSGYDPSVYLDPNRTLDEKTNAAIGGVTGLFIGAAAYRGARNILRSVDAAASKATRDTASIGGMALRDAMESGAAWPSIERIAGKSWPVVVKVADVIESSGAVKGKLAEFVDFASPKFIKQLTDAGVPEGEAITRGRAAAVIAGMDSVDAAQQLKVMDMLRQRRESPGAEAPVAKPEPTPVVDDAPAFLKATAKQEDLATAAKEEVPSEVPKPEVQQGRQDSQAPQAGDPTPLPKTEVLTTGNGAKVTVSAERGPVTVRFNGGRTETREARLTDIAGKRVAILAFPEDSGPRPWYAIDPESGDLIATGMTEAGAVIYAEQALAPQFQKADVAPPAGATALPVKKVAYDDGTEKWGITPPRELTDAEQSYLKGRATGNKGGWSRFKQAYVFNDRANADKFRAEMARRLGIDITKPPARSAEAVEAPTKKDVAAPAAAKEAQAPPTTSDAPSVGLVKKSSMKETDIVGSNLVQRARKHFTADDTEQRDWFAKAFESDSSNARITLEKRVRNRVIHDIVSQGDNIDANDRDVYNALTTGTKNMAAVVDHIARDFEHMVKAKDSEYPSVDSKGKRYRVIGKNDEGHHVREFQDGTRAYATVEGFTYTEPLQMNITRAGINPTPRAHRDPAYLTREELKPYGWPDHGWRENYDAKRTADTGVEPEPVNELTSEQPSPKPSAPADADKASKLAAFREANKARLAELDKARAEKISAIKNTRSGAVDIGPEDFEWAARTAIEAVLDGLETLEQALIRIFDAERFRPSEETETRKVVAQLAKDFGIEEELGLIPEQSSPEGSTVKRDSDDTQSPSKDLSAESNPGADGGRPAGAREADAARGDAGSVRSGPREAVPGDGGRADSGRENTERGAGDGADSSAGRGTEAGAGRSASGDEQAGRGAVAGGQPAGQRSPDTRVGAGEVSGPEARARGLAEPLRLTASEIDEIRPKTDAPKTKALLDAVAILRDIEESGRIPTLEERRALLTFPGWGWTGNRLNTQNAKPSSEHHAFYTKVRDALTDAEYKTARAATRNSHYTAPDVIDPMWGILRRLGFPEDATGLRMLEPSAGVGLIPTLGPKSGHWTMIELDSLTGRMLKSIHDPGGQSPNRVVRAGFEATHTGGSFDLAVSNVPFGSYSIRDDAFYKRTGLPEQSIHNYFVARMVDEARPDGIVAVITSRFTMDGVTEEHVALREWLDNNAEFLGGVRLPSNAFKGIASTEVVTDMLFFRKLAPGEVNNGTKIRSTAQVEIGKEVFEVNEYFVNHREQIIGTPSDTGKMQRKGQYNVELPDWARTDPERWSREWARVTKAFPEDIYRKGDNTPSMDEVATDGASDVPAGVRPGAIFEKGGKYFQNLNGRGEEIQLGKGDDARMKAFIAIRDALSGVVESMKLGEGDAIVSKKQLALKKAYGAYVKAFGELNLKGKRRPWQADPDSYAVMALERYNSRENKVTGLADIFTKRVIKPFAKVNHVDRLEDAIIASIGNKGRIDIDEMARVSGKSKEEVISGLKGKIFLDPTSGEYVTPDLLLVGNVRRKLRLAKESGNAEAAELLEKSLPAWVGANDIDPRPGAHWIQPTVFRDFINHLTGGKSGISDISYNPMLGRWLVGYGYEAKSGPAATITWGTGRRSLSDLFDDFLANTEPVVKDTVKNDDGSKSTTLNEEATVAAREALDRIRQEWSAWVWSDADRADSMVRDYNETMNVFVRPRFDGTLLSFPTMTPKALERSHRPAAVWRILTQRSTLLRHEMGSGKTLTAIAAAVEARRTGIANKPLIVVRNGTAGQFAAEFKESAPGAKVLVADENNFSGQNRKKFLGMVATGDWDAVVVTQSAFNLVEMSLPRQEAFYGKLVERLALSRGATDDQSTVKEVENVIERIEKKVAKLREKAAKRDTSIYFEDLGHDLVIVDEAHQFKNLFTESALTGAAVKGSDRAFDLLMKTEYIHGLDSGRLVLMTGTDISNAVGEMHTMMRYLMPNELDEMGMQSFDAFAATFLSSVEEWERTVSGSLKRKSRVTQFSNVPELLKFYGQVTDSVFSEDIMDPDGNPVVTLPRMIDRDGNVTDQPMVVSSAPSASQIAFWQTLSARDKALQSMTKFERLESGDNMLVIATDGRKSSIDLRLVDPNAPDDPNSKLNKAVEEIARIYKQFNKDKATQLVFLDYGVPDKSGGKKKVTDAAKKRANIVEDDESGGQVEGGAEHEYGGKIDLYADMKAKLVKRGIKESEVVFIQDYPESKREALYEKVRSGEVRVVIGSTAKMSEGINVQDRLIALHHLNAGWKPAEHMQRDARMIRSGNMWQEHGVYNFHYVTTDSFDQFMWSTQARKERFIRQIMRWDDDAVRMIMNEADDEITSAHILAVATGNPDLAKWIETSEDLKKLAKLKAYHDQRIAAATAQEMGARRKAAAHQVEYDILDSGIRDMQDAAETPTVTIKGESFTTAKKLGEAIFESVKSEYTKGNGVLPSSHRIGVIDGAGVEIVFDRYGYRSRTVSGVTSEPAIIIRKVSTHEPLLQVEHMFRLNLLAEDAGDAENFFTAMGREVLGYFGDIERRRGFRKSSLDSELKSAEANATKAKMQFAKQAELDKATIELAAVESRLGMTEKTKHIELGWGTGSIGSAKPGTSADILVDGGTTRVPGEVIDLPNVTKYRFFVHEDTNRPGAWKVSELSSGRLVVPAKLTREEVISAAVAIAKSRGDDGFDEILSHISVKSLNQKVIAEAPDNQILGARIQPLSGSPKFVIDPITGATSIKSGEQIIEDLSKALGKVIHKKPMRQMRVGEYDPVRKMLAVRFSGDAQTAIHEVAHYLDDIYGVTKDAPMATNKNGSPSKVYTTLDAELLPLGVDHVGPRSTLAERRREGFSVFLHAWAVNPDHIDKVAPHLVKWFEAKVPENVRSALRSAGDEIRQLAGAPVMDRAYTRVQMDDANPKVKAVVAHVKSALGVGDEPIKGMKFASSFMYHFVDDLAAFEAATKEVRRRIGKAAAFSIHEIEDDPVGLARDLNYSANKVDDILRHGMVNANNERVTGGMYSIFQHLDGTNAKTLDDDLRAMALYGIGERTIEKAQLILGEAKQQADLHMKNGDDAKAEKVMNAAIQKAERITGLGSGIVADFEEAGRIIAEIKANPEQHARVTRALAAYREIADSLLDYMVEKGRMSHEAVGMIRAENSHYIALQRVLDQMDPQTVRRASRNLGAVGSTVKRFKGSQRQIKSPLVSLMEQVEHVVRETDRNWALSRFTTMIDSATSKQKFGRGDLDLTDIAYRASAREAQGKPSVRVFVDGKEQHWVLDPDLHQSIKAAGSVLDHPWFLRWLGGMSQVIRRGITSFPAFALFLNPIRDMQSRLVLSRTNSGLHSILRKITPKERELYSLYGGGVMEHHLTGRRSYYDVQSQIMRQVLESKGAKDTLILGAHQMREAYATLMSTPEIQNRIVEYRNAYKKAIAEGLTEHQANLYAMREARDLMDFMRAGRTIRWLNAYVPFLNAQVQGLARAYRGAKEDPSGFLRKWLIYSAAPTLLVYAANAMLGKENEEEYLALPDYQRDMFYNIRVPGQGWVRIPKAFELGLASSAMERAVRSMRGDRKAWDGYFRSAWNVAGADMSTLLGAMMPVVEVVTNKDRFRNKAIIPPYEADLALELRKGTSRASAFGKAAQPITGMDARQVDHLINSYLGRVGRLATDVGKLGNDEYRIGLMQWIYHATGLTTDIPGYNSPDVQWVLGAARSVGARGVLENQTEAFFDAKTPDEKQRAALDLRQTAASLRSEAETLLKQSKPSKRADALKRLLGRF